MWIRRGALVIVVPFGSKRPPCILLGWQSRVKADSVLPDQPSRTATDEHRQLNWSPAAVMEHFLLFKPVSVL